MFETRFFVSTTSTADNAEANNADHSSVASKCGFDCMNGGDGKVTNSAAHIKEYIEGTVERLGFAPDLYYLHRIDPSTYTT